jgi:hypothetical protein
MATDTTPIVNELRQTSAALKRIAELLEAINSNLALIAHGGAGGGPRR